MKKMMILALLVSSMLWLQGWQLALAQPADSTAAAGEQPDEAAVVINRSWQLYRSVGEAEQELLLISVSRAGAAAVQKQLTRWTLFQPQGDQVVMKFANPAADAGLSLLLDRNKSQQQIWLKMPSWTKARRVSGERNQQYFAGTDLTFEDNAELSGEDTAAFRYRMLGKTAKGYWLEALPNIGSASAYSRREIWLDSDFAINRIDYFNRQGVLVKTLQNKLLQKYPGGGWRPNQVVVENYQEQRETRIEMRERLFDTARVSRIVREEQLGE